MFPVKKFGVVILSFYFYFISCPMWPSDMVSEDQVSEKIFKVFPIYKPVFCLVLYVPLNSYGHVETVSSPNHTFFLGKLD